MYIALVKDTNDIIGRAVDREVLEDLIKSDLTEFDAGEVEVEIFLVTEEATYEVKHIVTEVQANIHED